MSDPKPKPKPLPEDEKLTQNVKRKLPAFPPSYQKSKPDGVHRDRSTGKKVEKPPRKQKEQDKGHEE